MSVEQFYGQAGPNAAKSESNTLAFVITQIINRIATVALVRVVRVYNADGVEPVGLVDVQPLVHQMTSQGEPVPHGTIHGIPYMRLQGGASAVILDPKVGDLGACGFCSRDISKVKTTKAAAPPGSRRKYDWADGLYFGGFLNGAPEQYVRFTAEGVDVVSPQRVRIQAPEIVLDGAVSGTGAAVFTGDVTGAGISLHDHRHTSTSPGNPTSPPNP